MLKGDLNWSDLNWEYPITGVTIGKRGLIIHRTVREEREIPRGKRGRIESLSQRSLNKLAWMVNCTSVEFRSMMTLTYGVNYPSTGKGVKRDLNRFLTAFKYRFGGVSYLWFMEFQNRGAPHLHLMISIPAPGDSMRQVAARLWVRATGTGDWAYSRLSDGRLMVASYAMLKVASHRAFWENVRSEDGARHYVTKYATKTHQKDVPRDFYMAGRFWGCSRDVRVRDMELSAASEHQIREVLRAKGVKEHLWEFLPKHIWFNDTS